MAAIFLLFAPPPAEIATEDRAKVHKMAITYDIASWDPVSAWAAQRIETMTVHEQAQSVLMLHFAGADAGGLRAAIDAYQPGGIILMADNVAGSATELNGLVAQVQTEPELPLLIGIDEEGGIVARLHEDGFPSAETLRNLPVMETLDAFTARGQLLAAAGANTNFGVVADMTADPQSFIYDRSFGGEPAPTAERVAAAVSGEKPFVNSTIKHFPGHGAAPGDSHVGIPTTGMSLAEWQATAAIPFAAGIDAGAKLVMFGHLAYTAVDSLPASLSPTWHEILRENLGFQGVAITDDMLMLQHSGVAEFADPVSNAVKALAAGNDVLLYVLAANPELNGTATEDLARGIEDAVSRGELSADRLKDAALRTLVLRRSLAPGAHAMLPPCERVCPAFFPQTRQWSSDVTGVMAPAE